MANKNCEFYLRFFNDSNRFANSSKSGGPSMVSKDGGFIVVGITGKVGVYFILSYFYQILPFDSWM